MSPGPGALVRYLHATQHLEKQILSSPRGGAVMEDNGKDEAVYRYQEGMPVANFMDEPKFYFQDIHQGGEQDMEVTCGGAGRYCSSSCLPKASVEVCVCMS